MLAALIIAYFLLFILFAAQLKNVERLDRLEKQMALMITRDNPPANFNCRCNYLTVHSNSADELEPTSTVAKRKKKLKGSRTKIK